MSVWNIKERNAIVRSTLTQIDGSIGFEGARAIFASGFTPTSINNMDYVEIATLGDAADFGDLTTAGKNRPSCNGSNTRGIVAGGGNNNNNAGIIINDDIDFFEIATLGNSRDFGELTTPTRAGTCNSGNQTTHITMGGSTQPGGNYHNVISELTYVHLGSCVDFGDMSANIDSPAGCSSPTRAVAMGGIEPSDIRLKTNIEFIGKSISGINIYTFNYVNKKGKYEGVMAQEVPWASIKNENGYLSVDYSKIDAKFKRLN